MAVMTQKNAKNVIKEFLISLISVLVISYILFNFYTLYSVWNASKQLTQNAQQEYMNTLGVQPLLQVCKPRMYFPMV